MKLKKIEKINSQMKSYIAILLVFLCSIAVYSKPSVGLQKANEMYIATHYEQAAILYEEILLQGFESSTLYFNLGNAYFRQNKIAASILNYERALRLDPTNKDIIHNLEFARAKTIDKITPLEKNFLANIYEKLVYQAHSNTWAILSITFFVIGLLFGVMYFITKSWLKKLCFWFGSFLIVSSFIFFIFSYQQIKYI